MNRKISLPHLYSETMELILDLDRDSAVVIPSWLDHIGLRIQKADQSDMLTYKKIMSSFKSKITKEFGVSMYKYLMEN